MGFMATPPTFSRVTSLDALRGFDMLWILGLESGLRTLIQRFLPELAPAQAIANQLTHVPWAGFHFYDLIFPLFIFISGASLAFSQQRHLATSTRSQLTVRLIQRGVILFLLGVLFNAGLRDGIEKVRWLGVLQRIAIATTFAGILALYLKPKALLLTGIGLLVGYSALLLGVPAPGGDTPSFEEGKNIVNWFDQSFLPGRKHDKTHDPEGILSNIPAIVSAIAGYLAARSMQAAENRSHLRKHLIIGVLCIGLGWAIHPWLPIIKKLWTPSFVLVTVGWSLTLLTAFSFWLDNRPKTPLIEPLLWVGSNPIILYLLTGLGLFRTVAERVTGNKEQALGWMLPITSLLVMLALARWLHRRGILVRI